MALRGLFHWPSASAGPHRPHRSKPPLAYLTRRFRVSPSLDRLSARDRSRDLLAEDHSGIGLFHRGRLVVARIPTSWEGGQRHLQQSVRTLPYFRQSCSNQAPTYSIHWLSLRRCMRTFHHPLRVRPHPSILPTTNHSFLPPLHFRWFGR